MKNKFKAYGIYLPVFLILLAATVTLRTVAYLNYYNENSGYFTNPLLSNISGWLVAGGAAFFLTYLFVASRENMLIPSFSSPFNYVPSALVSVALLFLGIELIRSADGDVFSVVAGICSILAISYFVTSAISVKRRSVRRSDFGILVLIFLCIYIAYIYFDSIYPINAPAKVTDEMAFLAMAIFFLYETRLSLGRERWRAYVAFGFIAALLAAYSSIPAIIVYLARDTVISLSFYQSVFTLTAFIFALFKLLLVSRLVPERQSELVEKIIRYSDGRTAEITVTAEEPTDEEEFFEDEDQMSIADIDVEAEIIDAPGVEEGFLLEQELPTAEEPVAEPTEDTYTEDGLNEALLKETTEIEKDEPTE